MGNEAHLGNKRGCQLDPPLPLSPCTLSPLLPAATCVDPPITDLIPQGPRGRVAPHPTRTGHYGWLEADGTVAADFPVTIPKPVRWRMGRRGEPGKAHASVLLLSASGTAAARLPLSRQMLD